MNKLGKFSVFVITMLAIFIVRYDVICEKVVIPTSDIIDENLKANNQTELNNDNITSMIDLSLDFQHNYLNYNLFNRSKAVLNLKTINSEEFSKLTRDFVFVVDRSGSMIGEKIANVISTLKKLISYLNKNDRIQIVTFSEDSRIEIPTNTGIINQ